MLNKTLVFLIPVVLASGYSTNRAKWYGDTHAARRSIAQVTTLSNKELENQGFELIGYLQREWRTDTKAFRDEHDSAFSLNRFPSVNFEESIRKQAANNGAALVRREPNQTYRRWRELTHGHGWAQRIEYKEFTFVILTYSAWNKPRATTRN